MSPPPAPLIAALADRYRIDREIGVGGMATVYLAQDLRHDRPVAIKVLKSELGAMLGVDRFLGEIKVTANLQHPNLLPLFDSGEAAGMLFYVMPFVDGESLRARIDREKQLPVDDAVRIATAVASALGYAHARGVIHRDLKPENVLLQAGQPMIADFGIALAVRNAGGTRVTQTGFSLGTPQYMSPEQAAADRDIDGRSDIYSLGALTYEMLTGDPPLTASTAQAVVAKVLTERPPGVRVSRPAVSEEVEYAVEKALEKLPADRWKTAEEFAQALNGGTITRTGARRASRGAAPDWRQRLAVPLIGLTVIALGIAGFLASRPATASGPPRRLVVGIPQLTRSSNPVLSPVGDRVAFLGDGRIWVRRLDEATARPLEGTEEAHAPFWSPDGTAIAYLVGNRVFRIPADGGTPALVTSIDKACPLDGVCGGSWTDDGRMLISSGQAGIWQVPAQGGDATIYLAPGPDEHFHDVVALPNGRGALLTVDPDHESGRIDVYDGKVRRTLMAEGSHAPRYDAAGFVLYDALGGLMAIPFSLSSDTATGAPFVVAEDASGASVSRDGSILYTLSGSYDDELVWVDRQGMIRDSVGTDQGTAFSPALAPDGLRVAFVGRSGIQVLTPSRGVRMPLGGPDAVQRGPAWSADGTQLFYESTRPGKSDQGDLFIRMVRPGVGAPTTVVAPGFDPQVSPDGRYLTFSAGDVDNQDLRYLDLRTPNAKPQDFVATQEFEASLRISPDGHFAAYLLGDWRTGEFEVYLSRFPGGEDRTQVSLGGLRYSSRVEWSASGDRLYYVRESDGSLMEVDVQLGAQLRLSAPRVVFAESVSDLALSRGFAVSGDGSRFLAVRERVTRGGMPRAFVLQERWLEQATRQAAR